MAHDRINIRLGECDMFGLNMIAEKQGKKPGTVARRMIEKAIERYEDNLLCKQAIKIKLDPDQKTYTSEEIAKEFGFNV